MAKYNPSDLQEIKDKATKVLRHLGYYLPTNQNDRYQTISAFITDMIKLAKFIQDLPDSLTEQKITTLADGKTLGKHSSGSGNLPKNTTWSLIMAKSGMAPHSAIEFAWHPTSGGFQIDRDRADYTPRVYHTSSTVVGTSTFEGFVNWVINDCVPVLKENGYSFTDRL